jgi:hypothetical protein
MKSLLDAAPLDLEKIYDFPLLEDKRASVLSAASGLVIHNGFLFLVADDELSLASVPLDLSTQPDSIRWTPLLVGDLPLDPHERKKSKADFESLVLCEPNQWSPLGALLCLPSGSRPNRMSGVLLPFKNDQDQFAAPHVFNLAPLYEMLGKSLGLLNIEGGLFLQDDLILFHRGNLKDPKNWAIHLKADQFLREVSENGIASSEVFIRFQEINLGTFAGVPWGITDVCRISETSVGLLAAAEATTDPFADATCTGSALFVLDLELNVLSGNSLMPVMKAEGLALDLASGKLFIVTDADNRGVASTLFRTNLI